MSLRSRLADAWSRIVRRKPEVDINDVRNSGGLGPTNPTDAFDPMRTAPEPSSGSEVVTDGDLPVASGDPEEGGEITRPTPTSG